jgi:hypothetical protein
MNSIPGPPISFGVRDEAHSDAIAVEIEGDA